MIMLRDSIHEVLKSVESHQKLWDYCTLSRGLNNRETLTRLSSDYALFSEVLAHVSDVKNQECVLIVYLPMNFNGSY